MVTLLVIVACVLAGRLLTRGVGRVRAGTAVVKARSHWIWIGLALAIAIGVAAHR